MTQLKEQVCLFVCSSANTMDVFKQVSPSFGTHWSDCPYKKFVGLNFSLEKENFSGWTPLYAPVAGWRVELFQQVAQLPVEYQYILLFLDDFLLTCPVNEKKLETILNEAITRNICYLRLVPRSFAFIPRLINRFIKRIQKEKIELIKEPEPYYSSLQVSLWERSHLIEMLKTETGNIWNFEHQRIPGAKHYAVSGEAAISYKHVVEKGRWKPYVRRIFKKAGLTFSPSARAEEGGRAQLKLWFDLFKFEVIGYFWVKLKRRRAFLMPEEGK